MARLLIFGIDSASLELINPWLKEGRLPNLSRLMDRGCYGRLESVTPPMSPSAWTSFVTGKNPGKHGIFDFTTRKPNSYAISFVNAQSRKAKTIWSMMSDAGRRVCTIALPISYPPEALNGAVISGIDTPGASGGVAEPSAFHPRELYEEIRKTVGPYVISPNLSAFGNDQCDAMVEAALRSIERKLETALYLFQKETWDCFMVVIGETDAISHRLWKYHDRQSPLSDQQSLQYAGVDPLLRVYEQVDRYLGRLCSMASDDAVTVVMSDHGHGGNSVKAVYLNSWLAEEELLQFRTALNGHALSSPIKRAINANLRMAKSAALKFLPPNLKNKVLRRTGIAGRIESRLRFSHIDWARTKAFSEETPYYPNIWVNLRGREPAGIVSPGKEYEAVRENLIRQLADWLDPETGQPVVKRVHRREDLYSGPFVEKAPDLIIEWNLDGEYSYSFKNSQHNTGARKPIRRLDEREAKRAKSGDHRDHGLFVIAGRGIEQGAQLSGTTLLDLAPTLLHLSGIPVPADMDGRVLTQILNQGYVDAHPVHYTETAEPASDRYAHEPDYSQEEEQAIRARLRDLGYLE